MKKIIITLLWLMLFSFQSKAANHLVKNINEFNHTLKNITPGDTITLANGVWNNVTLHFKANGTLGNPIVLQAQTPGKVKIEGTSTLVLDGNYLTVSGLLFINGHGNGDYVISYAASSKNPSTHCRVTNCAIIDFNLPHRFPGDDWVAMYGNHNRFDHNYITEKKDAGRALVVKLNSPKSQNNHNRIDHNYFGKRERLGSNGGETIRIGTSTYSMKTSATTVEDNYFEHCNGEVEIISVKSGGNILRNNAFYECEGTLTLRHGNNNQIYNNIFIGNGKPFTGGVRVINMGHSVHDNYFFRLDGSRFRDAMAVMNGVPHSAVNRYHRVENVKIYHNTFIDCDHIGFGVGSDKERTAVPITTSFSDNIIYAPVQKNPISFKDSVNGISFSNNKLYAPRSSFHYNGFSSEKMIAEKGKDGLYHVVVGKQSPKNTIGSINKEVLPQWQNAGPGWLKSYLQSNKKQQSIARVIHVSNNPGMLEREAKKASPGDTLILTNAGAYYLSKPLIINKVLFIRAAKNLNKKPVLMFNNRETEEAQIIIANKGSLLIKGIAFNGENEMGYKAQSAITTAKNGFINHYWLKVDDCEFYNYTESTYNAFRANKGSFADSLVFCNSLFHTISGNAISIAAQKKDRGIYNAEYVTINNCVFSHVMGAALNLYRGGNDESTLGPFLDVNHCVFNDVNNKELGSVLRLFGVQYTNVTNSIFLDSGRSGRSIWFVNFRYNHNLVSNCDFYNSGRVGSFYDNIRKEKIYHIKPQFKDLEKQDFRLVNEKVFSGNVHIGLLPYKTVRCYENFPDTVL